MKKGFRPSTPERQMLAHVNSSLRAHNCNIEGTIETIKVILGKDYWSASDIEEIKRAFGIVDRCDIGSPFEKSLRMKVER